MTDTPNTTAATCTICGSVAPIWIGPKPDGCLFGGQAHCQDALDRAYADAARRKVCPQGFDDNGVILPGALVQVCDAMVQAGLHPISGRAL